MGAQPFLRAFAGAFTLGIAATAFAGQGAASGWGPREGRAEEADWRARIGTFRVGLVARGGARDTVLRTRSFAEALEKALGVPVEIFAAADLRALVDAQLAGRVDYAVLPATAYAAAWVACRCVEPVALPRAADGSAGFRIALFARADGPASVAALSGRTLLVDDAKGFALTFARHELSARGLDLGALTLIEANDPASAARRFAGGEGDLLLGWTRAGADAAGPGTPRLLREAGLVRLRTIWRSGEVPHGPHVVRLGLSRQAKDLLRATLRDLNRNEPRAYDAIEPDHAGGFAPADRAAFRSLVDLVTASSGGAGAGAAPPRAD